MMDSKCNGSVVQGNKQEGTKLSPFEKMAKWPKNMAVYPYTVDVYVIIVQYIVVLVCHFGGWGRGLRYL